jgi:hypothetical protein
VPAEYPNFYEYNGKRALHVRKSTVSVVVLLDEERDGVQKSSQVVVFPVEGRRETEFTFLHVQIQNIDY